MAIQINRTNAQIAIDRTRGGFDMKSTSAVLELRQKHAKINIESEKPKIIIDQSAAFSSSGLKTSSELTAEAAERGRSAASQYTAKYAADGDTLAKIESGSNPIPGFAERDAFPEKEFGMVTMPSAPVKIDVTGSLDISAEPNGEGIHNGVEMNVVPGNLQMNYTPDQIKIYLKQYASLEMRYVQDKQLDLQG